MVYVIFPLMVAIVAAFSLLPFNNTVIPEAGLLVYPFVLIVFPVLDLMVRKLNTAQNQLKTQLVHQIALAMVLPLMIILLIASLVQINTYSLSMVDTIMIGMAVGMYSGAIGMTAAHELIHRLNPSWRALGIGILLLVQYGHFRIEHIYGHHIHVATERDPATARKGEGFYRFFVRCVLMSYLSAWRIERRRMNNRKRHTLNPSNRMLHYIIVQIACLAAGYGLAGVAGVVFLISQAVVAIILTEAVDYIQHYGLLRTTNDAGKASPIQPEHSWNSRHAVGDWTTFNIGLHSHHHISGATPYPELSQDAEHHEMPGNYAVMILMALMPPLWFRIMDKRLVA